MKTSLKTGLAFGLTSGTITTLGVIIGLNGATHLKLAIIAGILTIAISDAFSDALGIHVSQEASGKNTCKEVWESTASTFIAKLLVALTFLIPILTLSIKTAITINIIWGFTLIIIFNYYLAKSRNKPPMKIITEHVAITTLVIIITHYAGKLISIYF